MDAQASTMRLWPSRCMHSCLRKLASWQTLKHSRASTEQTSMACPGIQTACSSSSSHGRSLHFILMAVQLSCPSLQTNTCSGRLQTVDSAVPPVCYITHATAKAPICNGLRMHTSMCDVDQSLHNCLYTLICPRGSIRLQCQQWSLLSFLSGLLHNPVKRLGICDSVWLQPAALKVGLCRVLPQLEGLRCRALPVERLCAQHIISHWVEEFPFCCTVRIAKHPGLTPWHTWGSACVPYERPAARLHRPQSGRKPRSDSPTAQRRVCHAVGPCCTCMWPSSLIHDCVPTQPGAGIRVPRKSRI